MNKIVFISRFSNTIVRERLTLRKNRLQNFIHHLLGKKPILYDDFAIWASDYISEFEKHKEFEIHVVSQHDGMKKPYQKFDYHNIDYHFYKCDGNFITNFLRAKFKLDQRSNYRRNRKKTSEIIKDIQPDLIILCGAENPRYGIAVLDIIKTPIIVILQTLLNDPKRIEYKLGSPYRRKVEYDIFKHANYFCTTSEHAMEVIRSQNNNAVMLPIRFPTHQPVVDVPAEKECDFVFFARYVRKNKGIEDILNALANVKKTHKNVLFNIIGNCEDEYYSLLCNIINENGLQDNVRFLGYFPNIEDSYYHVARAKVVVVPGITAALNSTVRESMLIGMPTICYETEATKEINSGDSCLLTARFCDVEDLSRVMIWAIEHGLEINKIAENGKHYAERMFGNSSIVNGLLKECSLIIEESRNNI